VVAAAIAQVFYTNSEYNVKANKNAYLAWYFPLPGGPVVRQVNLTPGWYTAAQLAVAVETLINAEEVKQGAGNTVTVAINSQTGLWTFTSTRDFRLLYESGGANATMSLATNLTMGFLCEATSAIANYMEAVGSLSGGTYTLTADFLPSLGGTQHIHVDVDFADAHTCRGQQKPPTSHACVVPVSIPYGATGCYEPDMETSLVTFPSAKCLHNIRVRYTDTEGDLVSMSGYTPCVVLRVWYRKRGGGS
jgi:hypothetical protein